MIFTHSLLCAECANDKPMAQLDTKALTGFCDSCLKMGEAYRVSLKAPAGARKEVLDDLEGVWMSEYCSLEEDDRVNKVELVFNQHSIEAAVAPLRALKLDREVMVDIKDMIVLAFYADDQIVSPTYHFIEAAKYHIGGVLDSCILIVTSSYFDDDDKMEILVGV